MESGLDGRDDEKTARGVSLSEVSLCSLAGGNDRAVAVIRRGARPRGDLRAHPGGINDSNLMNYWGRALRESRGHPL